MQPWRETDARAVRDPGIFLYVTPNLQEDPLLQEHGGGVGAEGEEAGGAVGNAV